MHVLLQARQRLKQNHKDDSARSSTTTIPIGERTWTDIEPQEYSLSDYSVLKKLINLLRHGSLPREDDGAIEFWRLKEYLRNDLERSQHWSDTKWKSTMAKGGGNKNIFQYCTDPSGTFLYLRALQGHSGRSLIGSFITGQCRDSGRFLRVHFSHRMCNQFTLHREFQISYQEDKI